MNLKILPLNTDLQSRIQNCFLRQISHFCLLRLVKKVGHDLELQNRTLSIRMKLSYTLSTMYSSISDTSAHPGANKLNDHFLQDQTNQWSTTEGSLEPTIIQRSY